MVGIYNPRPNDGGFVIHEKVVVLIVELPEKGLQIPCNLVRDYKSGLTGVGAPLYSSKRVPSERLKVQVLMRDGNKCMLCGITLIGENIHFDHILAWSKGGETVLENLQILCAAHNLAKANFDYPTDN